MQRSALPFFAYGLFRPGELGFLRLKSFVTSCQPAVVSGELLVRDGLPIADPEGKGAVHGYLLHFDSSAGASAYRRIIEIEPDRQYRWGETVVDGVRANILWGKSPRKGSVLLHAEEWEGKKDPLLTSALDVVEETLHHSAGFEWDLKPLFRLQMAYLLLWSSIERYVSLRYHLGDKVSEKVSHLAEEPSFASALAEQVSEPRYVYRADRPTVRVNLDPRQPQSSLKYYYQIRSNITHRGKGVHQDHERMRHSLSELLEIFRRVLGKAFEDARLDA